MVLLVLPPPDHLWIGRNRGNSCHLRPITLTEIPATGPELRIPTAAAQTRIISGGEVWPIQRELSRHLKYMARARISEFESSQASHAVWSPPLDSVGAGSGSAMFDGARLDSAR